MPSIDWHTVAEWLKTTIPGIIILGAIGSIVAVLLLKVVAVLGKRLFGAALDRFFFWNFRPFSYAALLTSRYAAEGRWADLVIYAVSVFSSFAAGLVLFGVCLLATIVVAIRLGVESPGLLVTLVVFTGVTFIMLLRDVMSIAGLWAVRFQQEHKELKNLLKNKQVFYDLTQQIFKNMQSPPQPVQPAAEPPPEAADSRREPPRPPAESA